MFHYIYRDHTGSLNKSELKPLCELLFEDKYMTRRNVYSGVVFSQNIIQQNKRVQELMDELDYSGDGKIHYEEWRRFALDTMADKKKGAKIPFCDDLMVQSSNDFLIPLPILQNDTIVSENMITIQAHVQDESKQEYEDGYEGEDENEYVHDQIAEHEQTQLEEHEHKPANEYEQTQKEEHGHKLALAHELEQTQKEDYEHKPAHEYKQTQKEEHGHKQPAHEYEQTQKEEHEHKPAHEFKQTQKEEHGHNLARAHELEQTQKEDHVHKLAHEYEQTQVQKEEHVHKPTHEQEVAHSNEHQNEDKLQGVQAQTVLFEMDSKHAHEPEKEAQLQGVKDQTTFFEIATCKETHEDEHTYEHVNFHTYEHQNSSEHVQKLTAFFEMVSGTK